jgi:GNAT superfamily N-acetyltransferase
LEHWAVKTRWMPLAALPTPAEAWLYLRNNGPRRTVGKFLGSYVVGRQRWFLTCEDLSRYAGLAPVGAGLEFRFARPADVDAMGEFTRRMSPHILRLWCRPGYFFFLTLAGGRPVSYRCLSPSVHPGVVGFVRLRDDQIFMVDEYTVPEFRRRGITRQMAIAMTPMLLARGYREVLGVHRVDNADTIAAARAKHIPRLGTITRSRVLWRTRFHWEPSPDGNLPEPPPARSADGLLALPLPRRPA